MSDNEVLILRREIEAVSVRIKELSDKADSQHSENRKAQEHDRATFQIALAKQQETFSAAMNEQRQVFQEAINKQFLEHMELVRAQDRSEAMLKNCVGDGGQGEGRLGALEKVVEDLKKFRWQLTTGLVVVLYIFDKFIEKH